jgi:hypothetical protein
MKQSIFPAFVTLASSGVLLLDSAPARALVFYSGLQNIDLLRPASAGQENTQSVELFPGQSIPFGWLYDNSFGGSSLGVGFKAADASGVRVLVDPSSPFAAGAIPAYITAASGEVKLESCAFPDLTTCSESWSGGEGFAALRQGLGGDNYLYGWARINMPADFSDPSAVARLVDWGYQSDGSAIAMGEGIPDPGEPVPGPVPAMGAAAAFAASRRLRRRMKQQTEPKP